tara:strand:- start:260 stop:733 length:474 start_codon:yes stop_codon:yes gene_type:complete
MKKIIIIIFFLLLNSKLNAKTIYLECEEIVKEVREATYENLYEEGKVIGHSFVKIKKKSIDIYFAYPNGESFEILINKRFKKTNLGFTVKDQYRDSQFKVKEFFEFIKPIDEYIFKRSNYFWSKETATDGENITDYDSAGRCITIDKAKYLKKIKNK